MVLHGDGRSNLYKGDCFDNFEITYTDENDDNPKTILIEDLIKELKPTKGIINPPYNDDKSVDFIYRCLELLKIGKAGKTCCVIAPSNCLKNKKSYDIFKKILETNRLETVIDMNGKLFTSQKVANKTSIYIFKVGEKHLSTDKVYFYDFKEDDFYYTERKMYDKGNWDNLKETAIQAIKDKTIIEGKSYLETINLETLENAMYIPKIKEELNIQQFIKTIINYEVFQIGEIVNGQK